jgi:hypothetical protein
MAKLGKLQVRGEGLTGRVHTTERVGHVRRAQIFFLGTSAERKMVKFYFYKFAEESSKNCAKNTFWKAKKMRIPPLQVILLA